MGKITQKVYFNFGANFIGINTSIGEYDVLKRSLYQLQTMFVKA